MAGEPLFIPKERIYTQGVLQLVDEEPDGDIFITRIMARHVRGDWGDIGNQEKAENEQALTKGGQLFSAYDYGDKRIWIITSADRLVMTILLPEEY